MGRSSSTLISMSSLGYGLAWPDNVRVRPKFIWAGELLTIANMKSGATNFGSV